MATAGGVAGGRDIENSQITIGLAEEDVERRHREQLVKQDEILRAIAMQMGVEEAPLREVLKKLGEADTPFADIPARLNRAADELIQLRADLTRCGTIGRNSPRSGSGVDTQLANHLGLVSIVGRSERHMVNRAGALTTSREIANRSKIDACLSG